MWSGSWVFLIRDNARATAASQARWIDAQGKPFLLTYAMLDAGAGGSDAAKAGGPSLVPRSFSNPVPCRAIAYWSKSGIGE
jgi:hypothetical protein